MHNSLCYQLVRKADSNAALLSAPPMKERNIVGADRDLPFLNSLQFINYQ
jgi:hypothetical protein